MNRFLKSALCITLLTFASLASATKPYYGGKFTSLIAAKEPQSMRGYQFMLVYDPQKYKWGNLDVYFDGGFSYFSASGTRTYTALNIYSIAPVLRYSFEPHSTVQPYAELSVGLSYLNHTRLECRNLGIHFAFQDRASVGLMLGQAQKEKILLGLGAVHYSNAHLSEHNSGITALITFDISYRFQ